MQSFDFTLQVGQVAVVDQHVVGVLQALVAPGLGLEDRAHLLLGDLVAKHGAL